MSKLSEAFGVDKQQQAANTVSNYANTQQDLQNQQAAQLAAQQAQAQQQAAALNQQAQAFDVNKQMQAIGEANAANARRMGATAGKAARLGNYQTGQNYGQLMGQKFGMQQGAQQATQQGAQLAGGLTTGLGSLAGQGTESAAGLETGIGQRQGQMVGAGLSGSGQALQGIVMSDETTKENVKPAHILKPTLEKLRSMKFDYKPEHGGEKDNVGIMAQDIAKTPLKNAVEKIETPEGEKLGIDAAKLSTGNTAMIKEMYDRLNALAKHVHFGEEK